MHTRKQAHSIADSVTDGVTDTVADSGSDALTYTCTDYAGADPRSHPELWCRHRCHAPL
jgi:hypothetical protein